MSEGELLSTSRDARQPTSRLQELRRAEVYPDAADSLDCMTYAYNRQGPQKAACR